MSNDLSTWENTTSEGVTVWGHGGYCKGNDDPEKTNTTYLDDSQPAQEITIKVDDPDGMSSSSYRDAENFHHLKNARLSHLPLPPSATLKIVTIHECESNENSIAMTPRRPPAKPSLAIFQSDGVARSPKGAGAGNASAGEATPPPAQGAVLHFFTRLRRHAIPAFLNSTLLSSRCPGSPKRHQFQRQRAASESMDQEDRDAHQTDIIQYIARTGDVVFHPTAGPLLPAPASPTLSLGRYFSVDKSRTKHVWLLTVNCTRLSFSPDYRIEPLETPPSPPAEPPALEQPPTPLYHDIWSLRASLEMYASADQGNDLESVRSDGGDSLSSSGGLPSFPSSLADEVEGGGGDKQWGKPKQDSVESESGTRKLLQMDSGYASIEAPSGRVGEDQTASEKRFCFTSGGRKATIFESFEGKEPEEEVEEEGGAVGGLPPHSPLVWAPYGQLFPTRETLPRRDYSIDEKTDALFNAFVRHDPQFDESPLRAKHRSRTHLRKQWQRTKQYSDPGVRYPPALERHRTPLRRGDSVNYPLEGRYHSTLPRIVSAGDEEVTLPVAESGDKIQVIEEEPPEEAKAVPDPYGRECEDGQCPSLGHLGTELMDKITGGLEERFYMHLKKPRESPERVMVAVADTSPDHSPE
ncbi:hypothetical protein JD844_034071 [Phrynosoma platyrhinos]|uniref:Uncharacterized protein n=1 Tax=Phrynosoma platyrhinos TaxID=52577 RepID=A0ABQ7T7Z8_PHRPL|nr:hypothetical protein JD844_034071 [Phrynosoma platyrhinos]